MTPAHAQIFRVHVVNEISGRSDRLGMEKIAETAKYVAAIITERGIARAPYGESLRKLAEEVVVSR